MASKYVDLRTSLRITLAEARALVECVESVALFASNKTVAVGVAKLKRAIEIADHPCEGEPCQVCGKYPGAAEQLKRHRAELLKDRLRESGAVRGKRGGKTVAERVERAMGAKRPPPPLKLTSGEDDKSEA